MTATASSGPLREHHHTGSTPGKGFNYVLDVHNGDDVLTDRFYLYDCVTELLNSGEKASVYSARKGVTLTITALDLDVPEYEEATFEVDG